MKYDINPPPHEKIVSTPLLMFDAEFCCLILFLRVSYKMLRQLSQN